MPKTSLFLITTAVLLALACNRQTIEPPPFDGSQWNYFPLQLGKYVVFQVDSVVYDPAPTGGTLRDSSTTYVKELVADTLRDNTGALSYAIERYERKTIGDPWTLTNISTASRTGGQAIRTEGNFRFLKLIFPMNIRSNWNGNLWIDVDREIEIAGDRIRPFANWDYGVDSIDLHRNIGTFSFDSTLIVTEANYSTTVERRFSRSWYAKYVGLVAREQWILDSQYCGQNPQPADCQSINWEEKAEKGYILRQTVLEFN